MSALDQIKADIAAIVSNSAGFNESVDFTATTGETATIYCIANKIGQKLNFDTGLIVNTDNATVVFAESTMPDSYPIRNEENEVSMIGHILIMDDSTGTSKSYIVEQSITDDTVGLITLILGEYMP